MCRQAIEYLLFAERLLLWETRDTCLSLYFRMLLSRMKLWFLSICFPYPETCIMSGSK